MADPKAPDTQTLTTGSGTGEYSPDVARDILQSGAGRRATSAEAEAAYDSALGKEQRIAASKHYEGNLLDSALFNAQAGAAGLASGFSFGFSDQALAKMFPSMQDRLRAYEELSPFISGGSRLAGSVAGLAVGAGEVGAAAKGLGIAAKAGEAAEALQAYRAGRGLLSAARFGAESAALGLGDELHENALGNEKLNAEKIIASMGHSALIGGALGGGLGLLSRGGGHVVEELENSLRKAEMKGAEEAASKEGFLAKKAREFSDEKLMKSAGFSARGAANVEARYGEGEFEQILSDLIETRGGPKGLNATPAAVRDFAQRELKVEGEKIGNIVKNLDKKGAPAPMFADIQDSVYKKLIEPALTDEAAANRKLFNQLGKAEIGEGAAESVANDFKVGRKSQPGKIGEFQLPKATEYKPFEQENLGKTLEMVDQLKGLGAKSKLSQWHEALQQIDERVNWAKTNGLKTAETNLRELRGIVDEALTAKIDTAGGALGGNAPGEWKASKAIYGVLKETEKAAAQKAAALTSQNSIPLRAFGGALLGGAAGGPVAGLAALAAGMVAQKSDMLLSRGARKLAAFMGVQRVATRADAAIAQGVKDVTKGIVPQKLTETGILQRAPKLNISGSNIYTASGSAAQRRAKYDKVSTSVRNAQPDAVAENVGRHLDALASYAPNTSSAVSQTAVRGLMFLQSKLPPPIANTKSLTPQFENPNRMVSDIDINNFMHYAEAVNDPLAVIGLLAKGKGTKRHVEALKEVYPGIYGQLLNQVTVSMANASRPPNYEETIKLGVLYDTPTTMAMTPESQKAIQSTFLPVEPEQESVASANTTTKLAESEMTQVERAQAR